MTGEFKKGDVLVEIGGCTKFVVVQTAGDSIVLDQVWFNGRGIVPHGTVVSPCSFAKYVKVGRWNFSANMEVDDG